MHQGKYKDMTNVKIRKIEERDTQNILKWRNSEHVMSVFIDRRPLTKEVHENWLKNYVGTGKVVQYISYDADNEIDFGSVYLRDIDSVNKKAEFGIFIGKTDYIGHGNGRNAAIQLIDIGFHEMGLNKIYARILEYNKASYNMFMKLGFSQDAFLREDVIIDGKPINVYLVSILKKEWDKNGL